MSAEMVELLTEAGDATGICKPRDLVHRTGEWHGSVHVWLIEGDRVVLQKRSLKKESCPGQYDVSASGHIMAGESALAAAMRETAEELGIRAPEEEFRELGVQKLCIHRPETGFISNEYDHIYLLRAEPGRFSPVPDPGEIECLRWMELPELEADLRRGDPRYCIPHEEAERVLDFLRSAEGSK